MVISNVSFLLRGTWRSLLYRFFSLLFEPNSLFTPVGFLQSYLKVPAVFNNLYFPHDQFRKVSCIAYSAFIKIFILLFCLPQKDKKGGQKYAPPSPCIKFVFLTKFFRLTLAIPLLMLYNERRRHEIAADHSGAGTPPWPDDECAHTQHQSLCRLYRISHCTI